MRVLIWHVHGSWTTAFVQGRHEYFVPVSQGRGPYGRGRARTWDWPESVREVPLDRLAEADPDVIILQRPKEEELVRGLRRPMVYLEHNAPWGAVPLTRHPMADRPDLRLVHVTHFNDLFWDAGSTPTTVIEHGIVDPGQRWTGDIPRAAVVVNEPLRRGRYVGTDLLPRLDAPLDVFGMRVSELAGCRTYEDLPQENMHAELARRRVYVHPVRWTSLGLSLLEAMHLGMPVVALATTEAGTAVPPGAGVVSTRLAEIRAAIRHFIDEPEAAARAGRAARAAALERYGLDRFLADWDDVLQEATSR